MTPSEFRAWRKRHRYTQTGAAAALGKGRRTLQGYEDKRAPIAVPDTVALLCRAIDEAAERRVIDAARDRDAALVREIMEL